jgi:hypothetical protein
MSYRDDLVALSARKTALETEVRDRQRELDEARRLVHELEARARLPVLDNLRVASPCSARWDNLVGDDRVRSCADCQKNVYNLSELTREDAEALIREREGRLCVRYFQRADGTVLFKDCPVGVRRRRYRKVAAFGVAASVAAAAFGHVRPQRCDGQLAQDLMLEADRPRATMGMMRAPDPHDLEELSRRQQELESLDRARRAHLAAQAGEFLGGTAATYRSGFDPELLDQPQTVELPAPRPSPAAHKPRKR